MADVTVASFEQMEPIYEGLARRGIRFIALGGAPGSFSPSAWTELGGPLPGASE